MIIILDQFKKKTMERLKNDLGSNRFKSGEYAISFDTDSFRHLNDHFEEEDKIVDAVYRIYETINNYDLIALDDKFDGTKMILAKAFKDHDFLGAEIASKKKRRLEFKSFYSINNNEIKKSKIQNLANSSKGELASQAVSLFKDIISNKSKKANNIEKIYNQSLADGNLEEAQLMLDWEAILNGYTDKKYDKTKGKKVYVSDYVTQTKSTDLITYDNNGKAIPLGERFDDTSLRCFKRNAVKQGTG